LVISSLAGCSSGVEVSGRDPEMIAAMLNARDRVDEFITALKSPKPGQAFAVKARFRDGDADEYLWLNGIRFDGKAFTGQVANKPQRVENVRQGDVHTVPLDEIADWAIVENGKTTGAFTDAVAKRHEDRR
jgi:uncharacterized protein YegJ (DUF2314 family)